MISVQLLEPATVVLETENPFRQRIHEIPGRRDQPVQRFHTSHYLPGVFARFFGQLDVHFPSQIRAQKRTRQIVAPHIESFAAH